MIKIGIIGGESYAAGELCRLLPNHAETEIVFVNSPKHAGKELFRIHEGLYGETQLRFTEQLPFDEIDLLFLCLDKGESARFCAECYIPANVRIIDLSPDFRLEADDYDYAYGLPELNRNAICGALRTVNPGSLATGLQLALLPLAEAGMLRDGIVANAVVGATERCGLNENAERHTWRTGNFSVFQAFEHSDLPEVLQLLQQLQPDYNGCIDLIPCRGDFARGIFITLIAPCESPLEEVENCYLDFYSEAAFTQYSAREVNLKQVVNTNKCLIHAERHRNKVLITACLDNLLKGAAGQAVQNMNLMFGLEEDTGLRLKPVAF